MKHNKLKRYLATSIVVALAGSVSSNVMASDATPLPLTVSASSHDGNTPQQTLDLDFKTRWSANGEGQSVTYDYGKQVDFNAVKIAFYKGDARSSKFDIEVSADGSNWTKVVEQAVSSGKSAVLERFDFADVSAQYIKFVGFGNTSNQWNSITEFVGVNCNVDKCAKVFEEILVPVAIESSEHDGNGPDRLFDNDIKTRWSANGESWATLDYGKVTTFDAIRAAFHKGDQRSTKFNIEVSADGTTWEEVIVGAASSGEVAGYERFVFKKPVQARYIKYVGKGNSSNTWNSVTELAGLNCEINNCPVEHIITAEVIAAAKKAAAEAKAIKHTGKVTTLDNWKLTIPATNESFYASSVTGEDAAAYFTLQGTKGESAAEILPGNCSLDKSSLNKDVKNPYFWADAKGWHFRTPLEGGTTTPNSTYIRSELRELGNGWKPCDESPKANWGYGGSHTLTATLTLDEIPTNPLKKDGKTPDAPKVVLGQIHAKDVHAATVKLLWEGANKPVRVILNKSTEKSAFSVKLGKIADPSKPWTYMIKMTEKGIELAAGGVTKTLTFGKELDNVWKKEKFYFKAGLYPQVYKSSGGAFEATFSKLSIDHIARIGDFGTHVPLICDPAVSDCSCVEANPDCQWWTSPLTFDTKPLPGRKPGENFDLTTWYLSQPFDHDNNGKPDDVQEWHLNQGYEHPEHFYTAADGGLTFMSYIKGVRTSKNTKYVRTELREMLRKGDASIPTQGVNKNNWVFSSSPIADLEAAAAIDGVLEATLKIDHTTTTGELGQVGRFIIGQIHDKDDEPIRLYYRKLPNREKGTVYFAHENTLEGSDKFFELVGGMTGESDDGIALGEVFSYRIEVVGNTMTVSVMRDGKPDAVQVVDMSKSGYDQGGRYMYFKVGVYNQNNSGDPEDYVQATFYKIKTSHSKYQPK
jgi:hypothetical protein